MYRSIDCGRRLGSWCAGGNRVGKQTKKTSERNKQQLGRETTAGMASEEEISSRALPFGAITEAAEEPMDALPQLEQLEGMK